MINEVKTLFVDNPCLPEQVRAFCKTLPKFLEAEREYRSAEEALEHRVGFSAFARFEEAQSHYMAQLVRAYYLFGLGLRQEVLRAMEAGE